MRVLITGSNGQVGKSLVIRLQDQVDLIALDRNMLDISDENAVFETIGKFNPEFIVNAAAYTAVDKAESEAEIAYAVNCTGIKNLANAANKYDATVLHISTDYVFPGESNKPYHENDLTGPRNVYGLSKLKGENELTSILNKHIILRTSWVFGEFGNNFVRTMLRIGKSKSEMAIVNDQFGGPTYAGDIADALINIMLKLACTKDTGLYGVYHYSGFPYVSWFEFADAIFREAEILGVLKSPSLIGIPSTEYPTPAARPHNSRLSMNKISRNFGIEPSDWKKALTRISEYVK